VLSTIRRKIVHVPKEARPVRTTVPLALLLWSLSLGLGCGGAAPARTAQGGRPNVVPVTEAMGSPHPGDAAPDFQLPDQGGAEIKLSSLRGSLVVLAFVTSWCPFSRAEQPYLRQFANEYGPRGVKFVAIDIKEPEKDYREYVDRFAMPFPVLRDAAGDVALSYVPPRVLPDFTERYKVVVSANLVLDKTGTIRFFGLIDLRNFDAHYARAREVVDGLLSESGAT
jgi:peroxiredoxin